MQRMWKVAGIGLAMGLVMASLGAASAKQPPLVKHAGSGSVEPGTKLKNYTIVNSGLLNANDATQTAGSVSCPTGTKPLGGGVFITSSDLTANINSSFPSTNGWLADVNNNSGSPTTFEVFAVCAKKPLGYKVVAVTASNPAFTQTPVSAKCTGGRKLLGGGGYSGSGSIAVNMNSMIPSSNTWVVDMNNATATPTTANAYAICGKNVTGLRTVTGPVVSNPAGTESFATVSCPGSRSVLGGGVGSSSTSTSVNMNSSQPVSSTDWDGYENNASAGAESIAAYVICAQL